MNTETKKRQRNSTGKPTLSELASQLALSKGTVSRILNDKGDAFSEETRRRVFEAAREIGYAPDPLARALATGRSGFVALWVQTLVTSYHAQVAHTMEEALERHGYQIAVTPFGRLDRDRAAYVGTPVGVDGVIAHEIYGDLWPLLFRPPAPQVPVVTTGIIERPESLDHVQVDIRSAATDAIRHLLATGRPRIAYASNDIRLRSQDPRFLAYRDGLAEAGVEMELIGLPGSEQSQVRTFLRDYLAEHGSPGAIFCHNDDIAIAVYRALCDLGLRVPDDCALVGCDGIPVLEYLPVPITTIVQPYAEVCETACRFLQRRLTEPDAPPQYAVLSARLDIRQSSRA